MKEKIDGVEEVSEEKVEKKREVTIPGEIIVSGRDYLPGDGTRREEDDIVASRYGLVDISGRLVKIIPLSGIYMPRAGNVVIGRVSDVTFNGWIMEVNAPYQSFLPVSEYPRFIKGDLTEFYDIGDMIACKVNSVKRKGIDLTLKGQGLGKLEGGIIIFINSNKVPRVIGREGSMIRLIKQETGCEIVVGQNGIIWIQGNSVEDELKAKNAIMFVVSKSFVDGLTEKVEDWFKKNGKKTREEEK